MFFFSLLILKSFCQHEQKWNFGIVRQPRNLSCILLHSPLFFLAKLELANTSRDDEIFLHERFVFFSFCLLVDDDSFTNQKSLAIQIQKAKTRENNAKARVNYTPRIIFFSSLHFVPFKRTTSTMWTYNIDERDKKKEKKNENFDFFLCFCNERQAKWHVIIIIYT